MKISGSKNWFSSFSQRHNHAIIRDYTGRLFLWRREISWPMCDKPEEDTESFGRVFEKWHVQVILKQSCRPTLAEKLALSQIFFRGFSCNFYQQLILKNSFRWLLLKYIFCQSFFNKVKILTLFQPQGTSLGCCQGCTSCKKFLQQYFRSVCFESFKL